MLSFTSDLTISLGIAKLQAENLTDFGLIMAEAAPAAAPNLQCLLHCKSILQRVLLWVL